MKSPYDKLASCVSRWKWNARCWLLRKLVGNHDTVVLNLDIKAGTMYPRGKFMICNVKSTDVPGDVLVWKP